MTARTTSQGQGRHREVGSEGSRRQNREPTNRNVIGGLASGASQHKMTKPIGSGRRVNDAVVRGKRMSLSGEICPTWRRDEGGARHEGRTLGWWARVDPPARARRVAQRAVTCGVIGQKSAEVIVPADGGEGPNIAIREEP